MIPRISSTPPRPAAERWPRPGEAASVRIDTGGGPEQICLGRSAAMRALLCDIRRLARSDRPVLIHGPTGSGKEIAAKLLHAFGPRPEQPYVDVNCGALPESLAESLLFGHEPGAFSGATRRQEGCFADADAGLLFLDEIAELGPALQVKLLRVLETRRFRALGSPRNREFRGRIVCASHADLAEEVRQGRFREDLYYRLAVLELAVPALDERREDIPDLIRFFARRQEPPRQFSDEAIAHLCRLGWPGNIRQLRNVIDRLCVLCDDPVIDAAEVERRLPASERGPDPIERFSRAVLASDRDNKLDLVEHSLISAALDSCAGNRSQAAKLLGVHRKVIERRLARVEGDRSAAERAFCDARDRLQAQEFPAALALLRQALEQLGEVGSGDGAEELHLDILLQLGACTGLVEGWSAESTRLLRHRAMTLADRHGAAARLGPLQAGRWVSDLLAMDLLGAHRQAGELVRASRRHGDAPGLRHGLIALANTSYWLGDLLRTEAELGDYLLTWDAAPAPGTYGFDPQSLFLVLQGLLAHHRGDGRRLHAARTALLRFRHASTDPVSQAMVSQGLAWLAWHEGDAAQALEHGEDLQEIADSAHLGFYAGIAGIFHGWARVVGGDDAKGIAEIRQGRQRCGGDGTCRLAACLAARAEVRALRHLSRHEEALAMVEATLAVCEPTQASLATCDLLYLRALLADGDRQKNADEDFAAALALARATGATALAHEVATAWQRAAAGSGAQAEAQRQVEETRRLLVAGST